MPILRPLRRRVGLAPFTLLMFAANALAQTESSDETLFESSTPETLVTLTFSTGFDTVEHYSDHHSLDSSTGDTPFSALGPADLNASDLRNSLTGSAFAGQGVLRSKIEIDPQGDGIYTATSTAAYTDTVTLFAPGMEGQTGTLHLEFSVDGRAIGTPATLAAALSLTLIGEDNFAMTEPFTRAFGTLGSAFDIIHDADDPLTTSLDMEVVFGEAKTYGASLGLTLLGEGSLDFSNTVTFTGATVTHHATGESIADAAIFSRAGIAYGDLKPIPEPSATGMWLVTLCLAATRRRRRGLSSRGGIARNP